MLLASGVAPRNIAAITFTELAAGELRVRVERFVNELLSGNAPDDLALAVDKTLTAPERAALIAARARLDELTATTIHGFANSSRLRNRAVSIPAQVPDAVRPVAFDRVQALAAAASRRRSTDPVVVMARRDPGSCRALKKLGKFGATFDRKLCCDRRCGLEFVERWNFAADRQHAAPDRALEDVAGLEDSPPSSQALSILPVIRAALGACPPPRVNVWPGALAIAVSALGAQLRCRHGRSVPRREAASTTTGARRSFVFFSAASRRRGSRPSRRAR
jgi:hypothetical protein